MSAISTWATMRMSRARAVGKLSKADTVGTISLSSRSEMSAGVAVARAVLNKYCISSRCSQEVGQHQVSPDPEALCIQFGLQCRRYFVKPKLVRRGYGMSCCQRRPDFNDSPGGRRGPSQLEMMQMPMRSQRLGTAPPSVALCKVHAS
jgi:hypothetical protein